MKSKERKRIEAEVRQDEYDALDARGKWEQIKARPGRSKKERTKLGLV